MVENDTDLALLQPDRQLWVTPPGFMFAQIGNKARHFKRMAHVDLVHELAGQGQQQVDCLVMLHRLNWVPFVQIVQIQTSLESLKQLIVFFAKHVKHQLP
uniref:(northern house mosquito) hypothetical protein n=1 Tax=Culex pipiens TaxID=7175 RepID=A0A8D8MNC5_CULPI